MTWRFLCETKVHGDKWDMSEGVPQPLARTGDRQRFIRRIGNRLEVA